MNTKSFLMIAIVTVILLIVVPMNSYAGSFEEKFEWVKQTFEENDAGVPHILERRGQAAYEAHNRMILERIRAVESMDEFLDISREWMRFFRKSHHQIQPNPFRATTSDVLEVEQEALTVHGFWDGDIAQFMEYVNKLDDKASYEGIWDIGGLYKVGIVRKGDSYIGFIIESVYDDWLPNMIKLRIDIDDDDVVSTFYIRDFTPEVSKAPLVIGNNLMLMGSRNNRDMKRLQPVYQDDPLIESHIRFLFATEPYFERLNENTLYFRLPLFVTDTTYLDRIIEENISTITSTENLIIDLRNNWGGESAFPLFEYLYTNPITNISQDKFYATEKNIQWIYEITQETGFYWDLVKMTAPDFIDDLKQHAIKIYEQVKNRVGEFVELSYVTSIGDKEMQIGMGPKTFDKIYQYPRNVGIIANRGTASAAEGYIIAAKQSSKVKVFGEPTSGVIDTFHLAGGSFFESPCGEVWIHYSNAVSGHVPGMIFDDIGIQPDFLIDSSVPAYRWVEHVTEIMNSWVTEPESRRRRRR